LSRSTSALIFYDRHYLARNDSGCRIPEVGGIKGKMKTRKVLTAAALAGVFSFGLFATSSFASGPIILGPTAAPKIAPAVSTVNKPGVDMVKMYRGLRAFWLSRAIVR
jgi:hypothetical protein